MKKFIKNIILVLLLTLSIFITGCTKDKKPIDPSLQEHVCIPSEWLEEEPFTCGEWGVQYKECIICHKELETRAFTKQHEYTETIIEPTCTTHGKSIKVCKNCGKKIERTIYSKGHQIGKIVAIKGPTKDKPGLKNVICKECGEVLRTLEYVNNNFTFNGELKVDGRDLVNRSGKKIQLYGLSTHGLQWFGDVTKFDTIANIQETFGNNVIRFAFYTDENGYCDGSEARKEEMLRVLKRGIDFATKLGLYVIIDWHMVGACNELDKNPLTYLNESKEFFSYISHEYRYNKNILYEIMNEPNGGATWADCKKYAEEVIPCIRKNTNAVILVGNPHWTADLESVMRDPLDPNKYTNIMYTYHFYARSHKNTMQVERAYEKGFPVFISEYGFMNSDGDGPLDKESGERWLRILDERNISYVSWNISNSKGSASIFKEGTGDLTDVSDSNLKEWGIYLKKLYRHKSGLDQYSK